MNYVNEKDWENYSLLIIVVEAIFATKQEHFKRYPAMQARDNLKRSLPCLNLYTVSYSSHR